MAPFYQERREVRQRRQLWAAAERKVNAQKQNGAAWLNLTVRVWGGGGNLSGTRGQNHVVLLRRARKLEIPDKMRERRKVAALEKLGWGLTWTAADLHPP